MARPKPPASVTVKPGVDRTPRSLASKHDEAGADGGSIGAPRRGVEIERGAGPGGSQRPEAQRFIGAQENLAAGAGGGGQAVDALITGLGELERAAPQRQRR